MSLKVRLSQALFHLVISLAKVHTGCRRSNLQHLAKYRIFMAHWRLTEPNYQAW